MSHLAAGDAALLTPQPNDGHESFQRFFQSSREELELCVAQSKARAAFWGTLFPKFTVYDKRGDGKPIKVQSTVIVNALVECVVQQERIAIAQDVEVIIQNRLANLEQRMLAGRAAYQAQKSSRIVTITEADELKRAQLNDELAALHKQLRTRRDNRIAQLKEASAIAKTLGIEKTSASSALSDTAQASTSGIFIRTKLSNQQIPLYVMGTEALDAERIALQNRRTDEFTEPRIAENQTELRLLNQNREVELLKQRSDEDLFIGTMRNGTKRLLN